FHIAYQGYDAAFRSVLGKPLLDHIKRELAGVQQDDAGRFKSRQLTAEFTTYGAACTRDEDALARQHGTHVIVVDMYGFPTQKILDPHRTHHVDGDASAHEFGQARDGEERGANFAGGLS